MKKFLFFVSVLAGLFLTASCQQENLEPVVEGGVTYTISLPETVQTKGQSGYDEYDLYYEVYRTADVTELQSANLLFEKKVEMQGNQTTLTLDLLNDQSYTILFWANKKGVDYFDLLDLRKVTVKQAASNNDDRDAFCGKDVLVNFDAADSKTVQLTRPFAQLNIATVVPAEAEIGYDITPKNSFVKVSNIPVTYNVSNGTVTGDTEVSFDKNTVPAGKKVTVNTDSYDLVAMNYVLVPAGNVSVYYEIETVNGTVKNTINNVPLKVNYRTNIIGNLLTSNADYTVEILPGFATEEFYGPEFVQEPVYDSETKTYTVTNYYELLWVADQVNTGKKDFYGETVQIAADIDLENKLWTPIGISTSVCFKGTFEGVAMSKADNGYPTIKNLYIENGNCSGFFTVLCNGGKIRNINFDGAKISGERQLGVVAGQIYGNLETPVVENVTVENVQITAVPAFDGQYYDNGDKVGGIAGLVGQDAYVANCTVKNVTLKAYRDMGGIVGSTQNGYPSKLTDNTVEDLTFIVTSFYHDSYKPDNDGTIPESGNYASIRGGRRSNANDKIENNTGDDITLHKVLTEETEGGIYDSETKTYTVTSPAGLENALIASGAAGAGDHTIEIVGDLDMTGIDWTPINVDGYHGADIVTVEGNGATITGLEAPLFHGGFAGGSGIVIKNLTIADSKIVSTNGTGSGAFIEYVDSMEKIILYNCHLLNSSVTGSRTGGLIGYTTGYDQTDDGPVKTYVTITDCSVVECTINGSSVGGINGHAGANPWTFTTIENCTVKDCLLNSTDDGDWRVGVVVGTANVGEVTINNITESGNTLIQPDKAAPIGEKRNYYGRLVPGETGKLIIDGINVALGYGKNDDGSYNVNSTTALNTVLSETDASVIYLLPAEYTMPSVTNESEITINGADGVVIDNTMGAYCDKTKLTFNNVKFKTTFGKVNGNGSDYAALYSKDVTYNECTFDGPMLIGRDGAKFINCTFNNLGNEYIRTYGNVCSFEGCTFNSDGKALLIYSDGNGSGKSPAVSVIGCTFNATTGAKAGAISNQNCAAIEIDNYGCGVKLTTSGNTVDPDFSGEWRIKSYYADKGNAVSVNQTEYTTIALDGQTMTIDADKNVTVQ